MTITPSPALTSKESEWPGMLYAHVFAMGAELLLGCVIFAALFVAPLAPSIKVMIGAFVLYFAVTADALSSEGEHQAHVIMGLVGAVPIHMEQRMKDPAYDLQLEVVNAARDIQRAYSRGGIHVAFRIAKYALWVGFGWLTAGVA